jgi:hypothetical protein
MGNVFKDISVETGQLSVTRCRKVQPSIFALQVNCCLVQNGIDIFKFLHLEGKCFFSATDLAAALSAL